MNKIFISYRRSDSRDITGRIFDHLINYFGKNYVFKDVDSIPLGIDFREAIEESLQSCDVILAIIGEMWNKSADNLGNRLLENPNDFVRIEIEAGLKRNIPIIPVLVGNTGIPSEKDLPFSLQKISFKNGLTIRSDPDFSNDISKLIKSLTLITNYKKKFSIYKYILLVLIVIFFTYYIYNKFNSSINILENKINDNLISSEQSGIDKDLIIKANSGDLIYESNLAWEFWKRKKYNEAIKWDYKAALQGGRTSQKRMGLYYQRGLGVKTDYEEAVYWHKKSAKRGDDYSAYNLARIYLRGGFRIEKDLNDAHQWVLKAIKLISTTEASQEYRRTLENLKVKIENELSNKKNNDNLGKNPLRNWIKSGNSSDDYEVGVDNNSFYIISPSFYIKSISKNINNKINGTLTQRLDSSSYKGKRVKVSAYVKSEYPEKVGNTSYFYISGYADTDAVKKIHNTKSWHKLSFVIDIPETAKYFAYGISLWGKGQIWIDDLRIEIVDKDTHLDAESKTPYLIEPINLP